MSQKYAYHHFVRYKWLDEEQGFQEARMDGITFRRHQIATMEDYIQHRMSLAASIENELDIKVIELSIESLSLVGIGGWEGFGRVETNESRIADRDLGQMLHDPEITR